MRYLIALLTLVSITSLAQKKEEVKTKEPIDTNKIGYIERKLLPYQEERLKAAKKKAEEAWKEYVNDLNLIIAEPYKPETVTIENAKLKAVKAN